MIGLSKYLKEEGEGMATPGNTMGMGNPMMPGENGEIGSEPLPTAKTKTQKRKRKCLKESILDNEEDLVNDDTTVIRDFIERYYNIIGKYEIQGSTVNVNGTVYLDKDVKNLTNGLFKFGKVTGRFDCSDNTLLVSLEGAPEEVKDDFDCFCCPNLKSLKGAPKEIDGDFACFDCQGLEDLTGAPQKVRGDFVCNNCRNLKSLKGLPKKIGGMLEFIHTPAYSNKENWDLVKKNNIKNVYITYEDSF